MERPDHRDLPPPYEDVPRIAETSGRIPGAWGDPTLNHDTGLPWGFDSVVPNREMMVPATEDGGEVTDAPLLFTLRKQAILLQTEVHVKDTKIGFLASDLKSKISEIAALKSELERTKNDHNKSTLQLSISKTLEHQRRLEVAEKVKLIKDLEKKLDIRNRSVQEVENSNKALDEQNAQLKSENSQLKNDVATLKTEVQKARADPEVKLLKDNVNTLREELRASRAEAERLKVENSFMGTLMSQAEKCVQKLNDAQAEIGDLRKQVVHVRSFSSTHTAEARASPQVCEESLRNGSQSSSLSLESVTGEGGAADARGIEQSHPRSERGQSPKSSKSVVEGGMIAHAQGIEQSHPNRKRRESSVVCPKSSESVVDGVMSAHVQGKERRYPRTESSIACPTAQGPTSTHGTEKRCPSFLDVKQESLATSEETPSKNEVRRSDGNQDCSMEDSIPHSDKRGSNGAQNNYRDSIQRKASRSLEARSVDDQSPMDTLDSNRTQNINVSQNEVSEILEACNLEEPSPLRVGALDLNRMQTNCRNVSPGEASQTFEAMGDPRPLRADVLDAGATQFEDSVSRSNETCPTSSHETEDDICSLDEADPKKIFSEILKTLDQTVCLVNSRDRHTNLDHENSGANDDQCHANNDADLREYRPKSHMSHVSNDSEYVDLSELAFIAGPASKIPHLVPESEKLENTVQSKDRSIGMVVGKKPVVRSADKDGAGSEVRSFEDDADSVISEDILVENGMDYDSVDSKGRYYKEERGVLLDEDSVRSELKKFEDEYSVCSEVLDEDSVRTKIESFEDDFSIRSEVLGDDNADGYSVISVDRNVEETVSSYAESSERGPSHCESVVSILSSGTLMEEDVCTYEEETVVDEDDASVGMSLGEREMILSDNDDNWEDESIQTFHSDDAQTVKAENDIENSDRIIKLDISSPARKTEEIENTEETKWEPPSQFEVLANRAKLFSDGPYKTDTLYRTNIGSVFFRKTSVSCILAYDAPGLHGLFRRQLGKLFVRGPVQDDFLFGNALLGRSLSGKDISGASQVIFPKSEPHEQKPTFLVKKKRKMKLRSKLFMKFSKVKNGIFRVKKKRMNRRMKEESGSIPWSALSGLMLGKRKARPGTKDPPKFGPGRKKRRLQNEKVTKVYYDTDSETEDGEDVKCAVETVETKPKVSAEEKCAKPRPESLESPRKDNNKWMKVQQVIGQCRNFLDVFSDT